MDFNEYANLVFYSLEFIRDPRVLQCDFTELENGIVLTINISSNETAVLLSWLPLFPQGNYSLK